MSAMSGNVPKTPGYGTTASNGEIFSVRTHLTGLEVYNGYIDPQYRINLEIY